MQKNTDGWDDSKKYNEFMGRWSKKLAKIFISWLREDTNILKQKWIEIGCGTGALTHTILQETSPSYIFAIDPSTPYLKTARSKFNAESVEFRQGYSEDIPVSEGEFDIAVSGIALNFMSDKPKSISEMKRSVKPNGTVSCYVWDYKEKMEFLRYFWDATIKLNPEAKKYDEGEVFPICNLNRLQELFSECGLREIKIKKLDLETHFLNFDDYWKPFLEGQGPSGNYVASLNDMDRNKLRDQIHQDLPISEDGSIKLIARAFAIKGVK